MSQNIYQDNFVIEAWKDDLKSGGIEGVIKALHWFQIHLEETQT